MRPPGASARCHREIAEWLKVFSHLKNLQWRYIRRQGSRAQKSCQGSLGPGQDFFVTGIERASMYIYIYIYIYQYIYSFEQYIWQTGMEHFSRGLTYFPICVCVPPPLRTSKQCTLIPTLCLQIVGNKCRPCKQPTLIPTFCLQIVGNKCTNQQTLPTLCMKHT